jgi:hypothetical protein
MIAAGSVYHTEPAVFFRTTPTYFFRQRPAVSVMMQPAALLLMKGRASVEARDWSTERPLPQPGAARRTMGGSQLQEVLIKAKLLQTWGPPT